MTVHISLLINLSGSPFPLLIRDNVALNIHEMISYSVVTAVMKVNFIERSVHQIHLEIDDSLSSWEIALQAVTYCLLQL